MINIAIIGPYIGILLSGDLDRLLDLISNLNKFLQIIKINIDTDSLSIGVLIILIFSGGVAYVANWLISIVGFMLGHKINTVLFSAYNKLPWSVTRNLEREYLITLFGFDSLRFSNQVLLPFLQAVSKIFMATCILAMLLYINFIIAVFSLSIFGMTYGLIIYFIRKKLLRNSQNLTYFNEQRLAALDQTFSSQKLLAIQKKTELFEADFRLASKYHARALGENTALSVAPRCIVETLLLIFIVMVILLSMEKANAEAVDLVTLAVFGISGIKLMPIAQQIYSATVSIKANFSTARSLVELYQKLDTDEEMSCSKLTEATQGFKSLRMVSCSVESSQGNVLLEDISLEVEAGQAIGIIGKSGSGKSTLLDCLSGLIKPNTGTILLNNEVLNAPLYQKTELTYVDSNPYIFQKDLFENITLDFSLLNEKSEQKVRGIIEILQLNELMSEAGRTQKLNGVRLSTGQSQRIGIGRALYNSASEIYFLDEITSALDGTSERIAMNYFYDSVTDLGKTIVIVAHRLETLKKCHKILVIDDGKLVEEGSFNYLSENSRLFNEIKSGL